MATTIVEAQPVQVAQQEMAIQPGAVVQAQAVGAPMQQAMDAGPAGGAQVDALGPAPLQIKQEWRAIELFGFEAKQIYRLRGAGIPDNYLIREESGCCERICCSVNRSLTLFLHAGTTKDYPQLISMHKPFHIQGCLFCCRPSMDVSDGEGRQIGNVQDPCALCVMNQRVYNNEGERFKVSGTICQLGLCCPCAEVHFGIKDAKTGEKIGEITKQFDGLSELCLGTNKFSLDFQNTLSPDDKKLLVASAMLVDLQYFESKKGEGSSV